MATIEPETQQPIPELPESVEFVAVQWIDVHGAPKAKLVPRAAVPDLVAPGGGAGFAAFANHGFARGPEHPEFLAVPDMSTLVTLPHRPEIAVAMSTVMDGDEVATCDARSILKRVQAEAAEVGLLPIAGMEPEFFLLRRTDAGELAPYDAADELDKPCYDLGALLRGSHVLRDIVATMQALDWQVSAVDHEDGNGQYEINFTHADALTTADRYTMLRSMIADIAGAHGAIATFMPKPLAGRTGSGAHVHMSALTEDGDNAFLDEDDPRGLGLSKTAYSFIGGVLEHARALAALTMPTVNSYRRVQAATTTSGATWAPNAVVYGANNRTGMIRIPGPGRFEDRGVDSSCNPYLALAAITAAGLDGVRRGIDPGAPIEGASTGIGVPLLPRTLADALDALEMDTVLRDSLGEEAICEFIAVKRHEWGSYMGAVSAWEVETYLTRA